MGRPPLSPAWIYLLMIGQQPAERVAGWVELSRVPLNDLDRRVAEVWKQHGAWLTQEAAAWGFEPAGVQSRGPRGSAREWARQFLAQHTY